MIVHETKKRKERKRGGGLVNKIINKLPFELHLPGYSYCGPGTKLADRLARGDKPINQLDAACMEHDIAYSKNRENMDARNAADRILANKAWKRVLAKDSNLSEKAAAYGVANIMKVKSKVGMGLKRKKTKKKKPKTKTRAKKTSLASIIKKTSKYIGPERTPKSIISATLRTARSAVREAGGKKNINFPRILPVPSKIGGILPIIPLFAGLSATGALVGGAAGVYKAVNDAKSAKEQLNESKRHNKTMEAIALGKGLYLKPYKTGLGLHLSPYIGGGLKKKSPK